MKLTHDQYQTQLQAKLNELVAFCAQHWGDAPELEVTVTPALMVRCNFDLGDFPHKGRSFLIHAQNESRRSPDKIATEIMAEVASHRNQCNRCGLGVPDMPYRAFAAKQFAEQLRNNDNIDVLMHYAKYQPLTPADEPERKLFPLKARKLDEHIDYLLKNLTPQDRLALIQPS